MSLLIRIKTLVLDIFFPRSCLGCGNEGSYVCYQCEILLSAQNTPAALSTQYIDRMYIAYEYSPLSLIGKLIKRIKYKFSQEVSHILAKGVIDQLENVILWDNIGVLTPVPLSKKRHKWRGFNQSEVITREISHILTEKGHTVYCDLLLYRTKHTPPQARLPRKERIKNVTDAFKMRPHKALPTTVCLVDDVYTTGATMNECARILKAAGAQKVFGLVIAKKTV